MLNSPPCSLENLAHLKSAPVKLASLAESVRPTFTLLKEKGLTLKNRTKELKRLKIKTRQVRLEYNPSYKNQKKAKYLITRELYT